MTMDSNTEYERYMAQDASPMLYKITFTCLGLAILVVTLRLFNRLYVLRARRLNLSEWLIIASTLVDIASCILIHFQIHTGMGKHIEYSRARPKMLQASMKVGLAQNSVYQFLIGIIKLSILAQLHVFAVLDSQKKIVKVVGGIVFVFTLFTTFSAIFQCIPMSAAWNLDTFPKGCWNMMATNFFTSTVNTLLDFVIFLIPIPILRNLRVERRKKVALVITYCVGSLAVACSIVRLRNMIHFKGVGDFTYAACMVPIWGAIECNAGIICACFPFVMPLFKRLGGSIARSLSGSQPQLSAPEFAHELKRSKHHSTGLTTKTQSTWYKTDSQSTECMNNTSAWDASKSATQVTTTCHTQCPESYAKESV